MSRFRTVIAFCFLLAIGFAVIAFVAANPIPVQLSLLVLQTPTVALGTLIVIVFGAGCALGLFINTLWVWRLQASNRRLKKDLKPATSLSTEQTK